MDLASAKAIGAGIAVIALSGVGVGIGYIFAALVSSVARNPAARERVPITNDAIKTLLHPNRAGTAESLIDLSRGVTLP